MVKFPGVIFSLEAEDLPFLPMLTFQPQRQQQQHGHQPRSANDERSSPSSVKPGTAALFIRARHEKTLRISVQPCAGGVVPNLPSGREVSSSSSNCSSDGDYFAIMSHGPISATDRCGYGAAILGRLVDSDPDEDEVSAITSPTP